MALVKTPTSYFPLYADLFREFFLAFIFKDPIHCSSL